MSSNFTFFTSDPGSQSTGNAFDQDAFTDITLPATTNASFTDTISTNPLSKLIGNDDSLRYAAKTLYINDLVLVKDRTLWINGKPTYQIIWNENCPYVQGYIFGNIQLVSNTVADSSGKYQRFVTVRQIGDGIGITGVFRKCAFIVTGDTAATATAQLAVDGVNTSTVDFSNAPFSLNDQSGNKLADNKQITFVNSASNSSYDIHDFRLTALQVSTLRIVGVTVYSENTSSNIDVLPGTTYVNKTKVSTTAGVTLPVSTFTGNLGGRTVYYKNSAGGYSGTIQPAPNLQSVATGSTGTNLLSVTTGTGASFPIGSGVAAFWGTTGYIGSVTNQSTDTLTVSPTLPFGVSGLIYKTWSAGPSLIIGTSQFLLCNTFDLNLFQSKGFSIFYSEPTDQYRVWGFGLGFTLVDSIWPALVATNVSLGFLQIDGYFSAANVEFVGQGILHATFNVNGFPAFGINAGQTGCLKKTVFTDGGPGWNSFNMIFGPSMGAIGINRINIYERQIAPGISYGLLAMMDTLQNFVRPVNGIVNATFVALGTYKRFYADELLFQGSWVRGATSVAAGGVQYIGSSTNSVLTHTYYGKNFAILGVNAGQGYTMTVDGAGVACTLNIMNVLASEGFHTVVLGLRSGTGAIHAFDITRTQGPLTTLSTNLPVPNQITPAATQSDMELANNSSVFVTPSVSQFHPSAAKAWARFSVAAQVVTIDTSYNISTITRGATGIYNVVFKTPFSSSTYGTLLSSVNDGALLYFPCINSAVAASGSSCQLSIVDNSFAANDPPFVTIAFFGDQ